MYNSFLIKVQVSMVLEVSIIFPLETLAFCFWVAMNDPSFIMLSFFTKGSGSSNNVVEIAEQTSFLNSGKQNC